MRSGVQKAEGGRQQTKQETKTLEQSKSRGDRCDRENIANFKKRLAFSSGDMVDFIFPLVSLVLSCLSSCSLAAWRASSSRLPHVSTNKGNCHKRLLCHSRARTNCFHTSYRSRSAWPRSYGILCVVFISYSYF